MRRWAVVAGVAARFGRRAAVATRSAVVEFVLLGCALIAPSYAWPGAEGGSCGLPDTLGSGRAVPSPTRRRWNIASLIELREIGDPWGLSDALAMDGTQVAFVLKQACLPLGNTRYGLYVMDQRAPLGAKKLLESTFLADLSHHPGTNAWTVRAELGSGVQLYDVDRSGGSSALIINHGLLDWGGEISFFDPPHTEGVMSYAWSPNGSALWYTRPLLKTDSERHRGYVFDAETMTSRDMLNAGRASGVELRYYNPGRAQDRALVSLFGGGPTSWLHVFSKQYGVVVWDEDSHGLVYQHSNWDIKDSGDWDRAWWHVDVESGRSYRLPPGKSPSNAASATADHYSVVPDADRYRLLEWHAGGQLSHDYGLVRFERVVRVLARQPGLHPSAVIAVSYPSHDGLAFIAADGRVTELLGEDNLRQCVFEREAARGVCVRESLTLPPEVVAVSSSTHRVSPLIRPNSRYDEIPPLIHEHAQWVNRYGHESDGYITYPRTYVRGQRYPVIVITHDLDARNRFPPGSLGDLPVEVFAERGYVVLCVNESPASVHEFAALFDTAAHRKVEDVQQIAGLDAVASMEAAVETLRRMGIADDSRVGIAGWSRGGEVVAYALSQSELFKAGIIVDGYSGADSYWMAGSNLRARAARAQYGGSPYDSRAAVLEHYRRFAPAFRAARFAGPLLLMSSTQAAVIDNMEPFRFLRDASVPVELVGFPFEGHLFWDPRDRAAIMQRSVEWFDYWLRGRSDAQAGKEQQYRRWDRLRTTWKRRMEDPVQRDAGG